MPKVEAYMAHRATANKNNNCTLENAAVRREWYVFPTCHVTQYLYLIGAT